MTRTMSVNKGGCVSDLPLGYPLASSGRDACLYRLHSIDRIKVSDIQDIPIPLILTVCQDICRMPGVLHMRYGTGTTACLISDLDPFFTLVVGSPNLR